MVNTFIPIGEERGGGSNGRACGLLVVATVGPALGEDDPALGLAGMELERSPDLTCERGNMRDREGEREREEKATVKKKKM
jgi:hypothetical protein